MTVKGKPKGTDQSMPGPTDILDLVHEIILISDANGNIINVNSKAEELTGYTRSDLKKKNILKKLVLEKDHPIAIKAMNDFKRGRTRCFKLRVVAKDGRVLPFIITSMPQLGPDGKFVSVISVLRQDFSGMQSDHVQMHRMMDMAQTIFLALDKQGTVTYINEFGAKILGMKREEIIGRNWFKTFLPNNVKDPLLKGFTKSMAGESKIMGIHINSVKVSDGTERIIQWHNLDIKDEKGRPIGTISTGWDLTDKIDPEALRLEAERKSFTFFEKLSDCIAILRCKDGRLYQEFFNSACKKVAGDDIVEFLGKPIDERVFNNPELIQDAKECAKDKKTRTRELLYRFRKKDSAMWAQVTVSFIEPDLVLISAMDLTDRKMLEEKHQSVAARYKMIVDNVQEGVWVMDTQERTVYVNSFMAGMLGYHPSEIIGKTIFDFMSEQWAKTARNNVKRRRKGLTDKHELEVMRKDGTLIYISLTASPLLNYKGIYEGAIAIVRDITQKKAEEIELRKKVMEYILEEKNLYLVKEAAAGLSLAAVRDLANIGLHCFVLSREPERSFRESLQMKYEYVRLTERITAPLQKPSPDKLIAFIENLPLRAVLFIDRFDYLMVTFGSGPALKFIYELKELAQVLNLIVILSLDPRTVSERDLILLDKECQPIVRMYSDDLPSDLKDMLKFINENNLKGERPSLTEIGRQFGLSKPTVRKKVSHLMVSNLVIVHSLGRKRGIELTEKGYRLFK